MCTQSVANECGEPEVNESLRNGDRFGAALSVKLAELEDRREALEFAMSESQRQLEDVNDQISHVTALLQAQPPENPDAADRASESARQSGEPHVADAVVELLLEIGTPLSFGEIERRLRAKGLSGSEGEELAESIRALYADPRLSRPKRYMYALRNGLADVVVELLREVDGPLHFRDIERELRQKGVKLPGGKDPASNLLTRYFHDPRLYRPERGVYALREGRKVRSVGERHSHFGKRPALCSTCDQVFSSRSELERHGYVHRELADWESDESEDSV